jgi:hypothetical protein
MAAQTNRARVFISCGQAEGVERDTAVEIARMLENELDFEAYVAGEQISFQGVKEAIFRQLPESEYFLFIDFPRDELPDGSCRGSLFANQELAIAAYLELDFLGFRHDRVRPLDGLLKFVQADIPVFNNAAQLLGLVRQHVTSRWAARWKKGLQLVRRRDEWDDMMAGWQVEGQEVASKRARFFHLDVLNTDLSKTALGCMGYIESIRDVEQGKNLEFRATELKWAGSTVPAVPIFPESMRMLDACVINWEEPRTVYFTSFSDSGVFMSPVKDVKSLDIGYVVVSQNLPIERATLRIELGGTTDEAKVTELPSSRDL